MNTGPAFEDSADRCADALPRTRFLTDRCRLSVDVDGIAVAVFANPTGHDLVYASDATAEAIDELQFTLGEGPCLETHHFQAPHLIDDLTASTPRWPILATELFPLGVRGIYTFPLSTRQDGPVGVLELHRTRPRTLTPAQYRSAQRFAAALAPTIVTELRTLTDTPWRNDHHLFRRANVPVAARLIAGRLGIPAADAELRLRAAAYADYCTVSDLADSIVAGHRTL
ncbi:GAF domain-containing protein [Rhodococcus sp. T2V]|uniref:GAF domain-containing protein n=1 Tax=Rhodococcus sp. T2V TaxID=3034164 RepID=UPI0023E0ED59|nr:GAF domain-containing protein [Rhodococcus sp. T2V]MDF3312006.1 GAF domain-containing protein [Rhodococcus sp. T2V]